jgi:signal transduction histidine kinase/ligand-binding sensor domain-containing protein/DNA-binding response OmpR family regulator
VNFTIHSQEQYQEINWPEPIFERLTIVDGLPENSVLTITQDHLGYMWFGTHVGLVRYDGYSMKDYQNVPYDSLSLSAGTVVAIYEDKTGRLWVGTDQNGLSCFDRTTETFKRYMQSPDDSASESSDSIFCILEDEDGNILVGTNKGLILVNPRDGNFKFTYYNNSVYSNPISTLFQDKVSGNIYAGSNNKLLIFDSKRKILTDENEINKLIKNIGSINSILQTRNGLIWIGHSLGLSKIELRLNSVKHYQLISSDKNNLKNYIDELVEDNNGFIWLISGGLAFRSLVIFDPKNEKFKRIEYVPNNPYSIVGSSKYIWSIYKDRTGIVWVGSLYLGLYKWAKNKSDFKHFSYDPDNISSGSFFSVVEDAGRIIWFGTRAGLHSFNRRSGEFRKYNFDIAGKDEDNLVACIYLDKSGIIWFGIDDKGLIRFEPKKNKYINYQNDPNNPESISHNTIRYILPEGEDILWIATRGGGINKFNKKTGKFFRYLPEPSNPKSVDDGMVECILRDREGKLWIGTQGYDGLKMFDESENTFKSFSFIGGESIVPSFYEDRSGNFWVGTENHGILLFDQEKEKYAYNIELPNNLVRSTLEDNYGNLWIGTDYGLAKLDPKTRKIKNHITAFDYMGNKYTTKSASKTSAGEMLFGTGDGFILFQPDSIKDDPFPPQVIISNVSLFNRPGEKLEYEGLISQLEKLELSHHENDLRFDYVGLHYADPSRNIYKYMLDGFDKDWVDAGTQRNATYTNLGPGNYTFKVKAANYDGVWSQEEATIKIIISNPWWSTGWAYVFYLILFAAGLLALRRFEINRSRLKNIVKMREFESKKQREVDEMKTRFIANLSHEFRTPLLLIKGPLEQMMNDNLDDKNLERCSTVIRNTENLQTLINQLLELSQLESSSIPLKAQKVNLLTLLKGLTFAFESLAKEKNINLRFENSEESIYAWIDREKFEKIINNLLSNSFKFTPEGGNITVSLTIIPSPSGRGTSVGQGEGIVQIKVSDTGIGIPQAKLEKIFDRFYQVDDSIQRNYGGSGIGLALVKELVDLHNWKISVNSEQGKGTEFTLLIPLSDNYLDESLKDYQNHFNESETREKNNLSFSSVRKLANDFALNEDFNGTENHTEKPALLIVEDSKEVQNYLDDLLNSGYSVSTAMNGVEGLKLAQEKIPDLIISDVMMPVMDGFEFCQKIKTDERTSHIPLILLTAKATSKDKISGLETGADDYIMKPFEANELKVRIRNLIEQRKKLREYFKKQGAFDITEAKVTSVDKKFLEKINSIINDHISDGGFSVDAFADETGMSRSQLHRKLVSLIGESPGDLIRRIRLAKAAKLIEQNFGNISEIALEVGFNNPANFAQSFKKQFGVSPTEYKK